MRRGGIRGPQPRKIPETKTQRTSPGTNLGRGLHAYPKTVRDPRQLILLPLWFLDTEVRQMCTHLRLLIGDSVANVSQVHPVCIYNAQFPVAFSVFSQS
jgi:hypothetical protein